MKGILDRYFGLTENGTNIRTELIAGLTTFLTMIYIIPLNGIIMSAAGMPIEAVITATAAITIIATILNGLWSNTPIAMPVGLGLNSYFAFALVLGEKLPWQTVLGIVFISGVIFIILTLTKIRRILLESITPEFRISISAGIGLFIAFIGLKEMGIVVSNDATLVALTFSITKGLAAGFVSFAFIKIVTLKHRELNPAMAVLALISLLAFII